MIILPTQARDTHRESTQKEYVFLQPENRKPFTPTRANPFASAALLVTNGPGLRRMAVATTIFFAGNEGWSTQGSFRLGVLGWTPMFQSYFTGMDASAFEWVSHALLHTCARRTGGYDAAGAATQGW